jgi:uncharacterized iron-regulated membrane protein
MSLITRPIAGLSAPANAGAAYRLIWRWHFYAGLFCLPFIVVLSLSGSIYLFKPQIDAFLDRDFDHLALSGAPRSLDDQVEAALAANPGARLKALQLRDDPADAARVHLTTPEGQELRVLVRPDTLAIIATQAEKNRLTSFMHDLHGELLLGEPGAIAVELAGAWAIVMVITGLYLWWPRSTGLAGVLYPRLGGTGRVFLRDLHGVTGFYLSLFALFFLISALPWTKVWGEGFKYARGMGQTREVRQDWTTGPASEKAVRMQNFSDAPPARDEADASDEHAEHRAAAGDHAGHAGHGGKHVPLVGFDEIAAQVTPLKLADPVLISPPSMRKPNWVARSDAQNRTLRETHEFDPKSFEEVKRETFSDRALIDRVVGFGVAAHEGQLFGWFNQLLGLLTAIGYLVLVVSAFLMWWRRRPQGALGAPPALAQPPRLAFFVVALVIVLGVLLPTLGASLIVVLLAERLARRFAPGVSRWLGLVATTRTQQESAEFA